jgi:hypothetical protein
VRSRSRRGSLTMPGSAERKLAKASGALGGKVIAIKQAFLERRRRQAKAGDRE